MLITSPALLFPSDDRRRRLPELTGDRITSVVKKKALLTSRGERIEHKATAAPVTKKEKIKRAFGFTQGISATRENRMTLSVMLVGFQIDPLVSIYPEVFCSNIE